MTFNPRKGHAALRRGRVSQAGSEYFLTLTTTGHRTGLLAPPPTAALAAELGAMSADGTWHVRCSTVMPDHVHLLIRLGERLPLARAVQRLKAETTAALRAAGCEWQRGFFDRRLRPDDERLLILLYIYLNPYRAGLSRAEETWPHFRCGEEDWMWFQHELDRNLPAPEWLM
ncbi:MAG: transposase [Opitutae bacterium]|nr:transposase [Opitutae bacterium]